MPQVVLPRGKFRGVLQLLRPANVVTACADVLAGYAAALAPGFDRGAPGDLGWLLSATACLYAGGVVLNDLFDRKVDAIERPERPIPSGIVQPGEAAMLGGVLLAAGIACAAGVNASTALIAVLIAAFAFAYDSILKNSAAGPVLIALCRACNVMLGVSVVPSALLPRISLAVLMAVYIAAITVLSRGEVHGGRRTVATGCLMAMVGVVLGLASLIAIGNPGDGARQLVAAVLTGVLAIRVLPPFWRAIREPVAPAIRRAVRTGILSLVLFDAAVASLYAGPVYGAAVLALMLPAYVLARLFAVT